MCGITGYMHFDKSEPANAQRLKEMTDCIAYRGPDGEGAYLKANLALGHRRLSIIDTVTGQQPMHSSDGKKMLVFNGEIYNYLELKEELIGLGHSFITHSDTEVLIKAYEQWGYDCQNKFNGMWAFALWDETKQTLFLSRDRIGEKPLHYSVYQHTFIFASEIKSILAFGVPKQIRPELIEIYLALTNIPAPDSFYKDIFKLMPGHYLLVKEGRVSEERYWEFPQVKEEDMIRDRQEVYNTFEALLTDAVKIRMRSDVPFGAFLSGGLDSSAVVSLMAKLSEHPVKTFTIGFDEKAFDESALAEEVAAKFHTEHHPGKISPGDFAAFINRVSQHCDEPFGDSSAIPTDMVSAYAARQVKMVLTGDGGDEALGGYMAYKAVKVSSAVNRYLPRLLQRVLLFSLGLAQKAAKGSLRFRLGKISRALDASRQPFAERMAKTMAFASLQDIKQLCSGIPNLVPVETYFESLLARCRFQDDFYKLMYVHYNYLLPNDYLVKVDRMSMANSIETRLPFLDYRLVEFMARVHKDVKLPGWKLKSVLRNTVGRQLPASVQSAPKRGFTVPLREWFKAQQFDNLAESNLQRVSTLLDQATLNRIISENRQGKKDNGNFIWALLQLDQFLPQAAA
jgi:asparagine synthase (glutamine-hydrolysing)